MHRRRPHPRHVAEVSPEPVRVLALRYVLDLLSRDKQPLCGSLLSDDTQPQHANSRRLG